MRLDLYNIALAGEEVRTAADVVVHEGQHGLDMAEFGTPLAPAKTEKRAYNAQFEARMELDRQLAERRKDAAPNLIKRFFENIPEDYVPSAFKPQYEATKRKTDSTDALE